MEMDLEGTVKAEEELRRAFRGMSLKEREDAFVEEALLATTDGLTGLVNTRGFNNELVKAVSLYVRHSDNISILYYDVAGLKGVNDSFGHGEGDNVLRRVAEILLRATRTEDCCARISEGGDEFTVLMNYINPEGALVVAQRIETALREDPLLKKYGVTLNYGIASMAEILPQEETGQRKSYPVEELGNALMKLAEKRMYANKEDYYQKTGIERRK